jgi:uncharacterized protein
MLFGARGTGKSRLVPHLLASTECLTVNLLQPELERALRRNPSSLTDMIKAHHNPEWVFIDEIQKVPELLNVIHHLIEETQTKFALTGSSARKLKHGAANLLAGRAFSYELYPFTAHELKDKFILNEAIAWGTMPKLTELSNAEEKKLFLESYALTYLNEEVLAEQLVRRAIPFKEFLSIAAQMHGEPINFTSIGRSIGSDHKTVRTYFDILADTLVGFYVTPFISSSRKRLAASPKFYFFDLGVKRALEFSLGETISTSSYGYGKAFETVVLLEIVRLNSYFRTNFQLHYLRTQQGVEVDLVIKKGSKNLIFVEIKSADSVRSEHLRNITRLSEEFRPTTSLLLSRDPVARIENGIEVMPWQMGISKLFGTDEVN